MEQPNNKIQVAIIGASSQVGSSVALYFKKYTFIEPICFIRSKYSLVFFDILNIKTENVDLTDSKLLSEKLSGILWVLDFTYPAGQVAEIPKKIETIISNITKAMQPGANYIYMSSIMAYGMANGDKYLKNHYFSKSTYSYIKRKAEKFTIKYSKKNRIIPYIFRLSQVHGFLQSVNTSYHNKLKNNSNHILDVDSSDLSNTIFISSLGEAITKCIKGGVRPGLYTLVSYPQWTMQQLYDYYNQFFNENWQVQFVPSIRSKQLTLYKQKVTDKIKAMRPILEAYVLMKFPSFSSKLKGKYRKMETKREIEMRTKDFFDFHIVGKPSTKIIENIKSDLKTVFKIEKDLMEYYNSKISSTKK